MKANTGGLIHGPIPTGVGPTLKNWFRNASQYFILYEALVVKYAPEIFTKTLWGFVCCTGFLL